MTPDERIQEIFNLLPAMQNTALRGWLNERRNELVVTLISSNNEDVRGRIKQLDELLELPERLQQEVTGLKE